MHPNYPPFYFLRGNIYLTLKSFDLALDDFNKIIELNPINMDAYNSRGITYFEKDLFDIVRKEYGQWWSEQLFSIMEQHPAAICFTAVSGE